MNYVPPHKSAQQRWKNLLQKLLLLLLLLLILSLHLVVGPGGLLVTILKSHNHSQK